MIVRPRPIAETGDTVTYSRTDVDRLFEQLEDLEARAAYTATRAEEKLPAGDNPVRVFREHRSLSAALLAEKSGITVSYLAAIESGGRRASLKALSALAAVLGVSVEDLRS